MSSQAATGLPAFHLGSSGLPGDEAYEAWRQIMARMFLIQRAQPERLDPAGGLPRGEMSAVLLGDVMANRSQFTTQRLTRDDRRIGSTPDHLVLQLYRSGGYAGEIGGAPTRIARGQIAVCDLRRPLDVQAQTSETIGLTIPRHLLDGVDLDHVPARLDPARERLLAARMTRLHLRLPTLSMADAAADAADLVAVLRRLFDPSAAADVLDGCELDGDLVTLAEQVVASEIGSPELSPAIIAEKLQVSRATLFRAFAPRGGVERHIWEMRLQAMRAALDQPVERRSVSQLGTALGFKSPAHLSRSFRARYGVAPSEWRAQRMIEAGSHWHDELGRLAGCWHALGQ